MAPRKRASTGVDMSDPSVVFSAECVAGNLSTKELRGRLEAVTRALGTGDDGADIRSEHGPGLEALAAALVEPRIVRSNDAGVVVTGAMVLAQLLRVYAPNAPYSSADEVKTIFSLFHRVLRKYLTADTTLYPRVFALLEELVRTQSYILLIEFELHDLVLDLYRLCFELAPALRSDQHHIKPYLLSILTSLVEEADAVPQEALDEVFMALIPGAAGASDAANELAVALVQNATTRLQPYVTSWLHDVVLAGKGSEYEMADSAPHLVFALYAAAPSILLYVLPQLEEHLKTEEVADRASLVKLVGNLAALAAPPGGSLYEKYPPLFGVFLERFRDVNAGIRAAMVRMAPAILDANAAIEAVADDLVPLVVERADDADPVVRVAAVDVIATLASSPAHAARFATPLQQVGPRLLDRKPAVAKAAIAALARAFVTYRDAFLDDTMTPDKAAAEWVPGSLLSLLANISVSLGGGDAAIGAAMDPTALRALAARSGVDADQYALCFEIERVFDDVIMPGGCASGRDVDAADQAETLLFVYDTAPRVARQGLEILLRLRAQFYVLLTAYLKLRLVPGTASPDAEARMADHLAALGCMLTGHSRARVTESLAALHAIQDNNVFKALAALASPALDTAASAAAQAAFVTAASAACGLSGGARRAAFADVMAQMARKAANPYASSAVTGVLLAQIESIRSKFASGAHDDDGDEPLDGDALAGRVGGLVVALSLTALLGRSFPYAFASEHAVFLSLLAPAHAESDPLARQTGLELLLATGLWLDPESPVGTALPQALLALLPTATVNEASLAVSILAKTHRGAGSRSVAAALAPFIDALVSVAGTNGEGAWRTARENGGVAALLALWAQINTSCVSALVPHLEASLIPFAKSILELPSDYLAPAELAALADTGLADDVREANADFAASLAQAEAGSAKAAELIAVSWSDVPSHTTLLKGCAFDALASLATALASHESYSDDAHGSVTAFCVDAIAGVLASLMDEESAEAGHVRLLAVKALLSLESLAHRAVLGPALTAAGAYGLVALCIQDPVFEVRAGVARAIFDAASHSALATKYLALLTLASVDPERDNQDAAATFLRTLVAARRADAARAADNAQLHATLAPEYALPHFIHMLASHPDYPVDGQLDDYVKYLSVLLDAITTKGDNFAFVHTILNTLLAAEDATGQSPILTPRIYMLVELSLTLLKDLTDKRSWKLSAHPGAIMLPTALFRPSPNPATLSATHSYLPPSFSIKAHASRRDLIVGYATPDRSLRASAAKSSAKASRLSFALTPASGASAASSRKRKFAGHENEPNVAEVSKVAKSLRSPPSPTLARRSSSRSRALRS